MPQYAYRCVEIRSLVFVLSIVLHLAVQHNKKWRSHSFFFFKLQTVYSFVSENEHERSLRFLNKDSVQFGTVILLQQGHKVESLSVKFLSQTDRRRDVLIYSYTVFYSLLI